MKTKPNLHFPLSNAIFAIAISAANLFGQARPGQAAEPSMFDSFGFWGAIAAAAGMGGILFFVRKNRQKEESAINQPVKADDRGRMTYKESRERPAAMPKVEKVKVEPAVKRVSGPHTFKRLQWTNTYVDWPESTDAALLRAIDQTNEESEADVQTRVSALKLLAGYKNSNAVAAIAQVALYDLSSKLRADAVGALADFDHESVFETIVTACADPTREVRAAAARALFKLSFDRGQAWTRIIESRDMPRMRHAARCAIEGDLVERSFDRLVHPDRSVAYEVFALTALLIKADETEPVYKAIATHKDENVKLALLNVLQVMNSETAIEGLSELLEKESLSPAVAAKASDLMESVALMHA